MIIYILLLGGYPCECQGGILVMLLNFYNNKIEWFKNMTVKMNQNAIFLLMMTDYIVQYDYNLIFVSHFYFVFLLLSIKKYDVHIFII